MMNLLSEPWYSMPLITANKENVERLIEVTPGKKDASNSELKQSEN